MDHKKTMKPHLFSGFNGFKITDSDGQVELEIYHMLFDQF